MSYTWRSLVDLDVEQWSQLTTRVAAFDGSSEPHRPEDLREELDELDAERDGFTVLHDGRLVALGIARVRAAVFEDHAPATTESIVDPEHRDAGLDEELLVRLEARARELAARDHPGRPVRLTTHAAEAATDRHDMLQAHGYRPARWFTAMRLELAAWSPPERPDPRVSAYRAELDGRVHAAHLAAFADHWGSPPPSDPEWRLWYTGSRTFRPATSRVVLGPDGTVHAYALTYEYQDGEIDVGQLGVRPDQQRRGLGRACLQAALTAAHAAGYRASTLGVDTQNRHDAGALYERLGYRADRRLCVHLKYVDGRPAPDGG